MPALIINISDVKFVRTLPRRILNHGIINVLKDPDDLKVSLFSSLTES